MSVMKLDEILEESSADTKDARGIHEIMSGLATSENERSLR
jgi:hypothetical protein